MRTFCEISSKISFMCSINNIFPVNFNTTANYYPCIKIFLQFQHKNYAHHICTKKKNLHCSGLVADNKHFAKFFLVPNMHYVTEEGITFSLVWSTLLYPFHTLFHFMFPPVFFLILLFNIFSKALHVVETHLRNLALPQSPFLPFQASSSPPWRWNLASGQQKVIP